MILVILDTAVNGRSAADVQIICHPVEISHTRAAVSKKACDAIRLVIARASPKTTREADPRLPLGTPCGSAGWMGTAGLDEAERLFCRSPCRRQNRYEHAALGFGTEFEAPVDQREQGMILRQTDVGARVPLGAALPRNDVAGEQLIAAENLQAMPLTFRVATV